MRNIKDIDTDTLLQMYSNCNTTAKLSGGHHKAQMNEDYKEWYAKELRNRNVYVFANLQEEIDNSFCVNVEIPEGIFNGNGTY